MANTFTALFVSGTHSGPDPSPGLGIARSVKQADPQIRLIAKDYSLRSSGLHDLIFDEFQVMPAWSEMALDAHHVFLVKQLKEMNALYISGLDAEIDWLSTLNLSPSKVLTPSATALSQIQKPRISCAGELGMRIPEFVPATASQIDLHKLARRSGWRIWIKGKFHEAYAARSHGEMLSRLSQMQATWPIEDIFVQCSIQGLERSYTFAAFEGQLLGVAEVEKRSQTSAGKTWAAEVTMPSAEIIEKIAAFTKRTAWTGGCEIEFIRDRDDQDWLIDINPRFPAYIHGVTVCGLNLPGRLIAAVKGELQSDPSSFGGQFTRIVTEIPVRLNSYIPPTANAETSILAAQKHPSFQPLLVNKRQELDGVLSRRRQKISDRSSMLQVRPALGARIRTSSQESIDASLCPIEEVLSDLSNRIRATPALSIKTDPQEFLARAYLEKGWYAEAISDNELSWAKRLGFKSDRLILNGPAAASTAVTIDGAVRYAFADSMISLATLAQATAQISLGIRIRPSRVMSRFGIDLTDYRSYISTLDIIASLGTDRDLAVHFHLPADQIGPAAWLDCFDESISWTATIARETGVNISAFDIGGGWHTDDFTEILFPILREQVAPRVADLGVSVELIFEPGKAVSSNLAQFIATVVEVRDPWNVDSVDVLVDCSIADLPMTQHYAHKIEQYRGSMLLGALSGGKDRILGSICMESDILATGVSFPRFPKCGDKLIFSGAGAYNSSMAWPFAGGITRD
jgi:diaminopimelate decarboxylase